MVQEKKEREIKREEAAKLEEERFLADPESWLKEKRNERSALRDKITERKKLSGQMPGNRRDRSAMSGRMQVLANLADDPSGRKKGGKAVEDTFGASDADWLVYRDIVHFMLLY